MKLTTPIDIPVSPWHIGYEDHILLLGSCFADEMAKQMQERYLSVVSNPFGTLYNPLSIANAINLPMEIGNNQSQITSLPSGWRIALTWQSEQPEQRGASLQPERSGVGFPIFNYNGLYHSMYHHGSFSRPTREETEQAVLASIEAMQKALNEASVIIVTFGTAWVYEMPADPLNPSSSHPFIVANCHKLPDSYFTRRRLTVEEIVAAWEPIIARYPDKHWLFTVSPIRHIKDGLHENQLSKATLLMAIDQLTNTQSQITSLPSREGSGVGFYFPSYELLLDELRDYRFYAEDLVHPSATAVKYIWERFVQTFCTPQTQNELNLKHKQWKATQHRPLHAYDGIRENDQ